MRIIAGLRRGHKFDAPAGGGMRPTSDLVREAMFNILGDRVADRLVIDLYAGTGALGLEALSRGAARAIFVEQDRGHAALIRRNLATLRFEDRAIVLNADAIRWARGFDPIDDEPVILFVDPPYREYENHPDRVRGVLADLIGRLPRDSIVVVESGRSREAEPLPDPDAWDVRRYGGTRVALRTVGEGRPDGDPDGEGPGARTPAD